MENKDDKIHNMAACMLSILDSLKLRDNEKIDDDNLANDEETLSEMMFRKMKGYNVDLNKELNFTHLEPVKSVKVKPIEKRKNLLRKYLLENKEQVKKK